MLLCLAVQAVLIYQDLDTTKTAAFSMPTGSQMVDQGYQQYMNLG